MRYTLFIQCFLSLSLIFSPASAIAHAGHGDEFQSTGGVNRVEVNAETDSLLGIQVSPIEAGAGDSSVLIPITALVEDNDRQLVFVKYENFYEPVDVTVGETQGELIEVIEGLSEGEQLVSQGSLSLYAESRKTQTADASQSADSTPAAVSAPEPTQSESEGAVSEASGESENSFPMGLAIAIASGVGLLVAGGAFLKSQKAD